MIKFKIGDSVVLSKISRLNTSIVLEHLKHDTVYTVRKLQPNRHGVYLDRCSKNNICTCTEGYWQNEHFTLYRKRVAKLTKTEVANAATIPSHDVLEQFLRDTKML